MDQCPSGMSHAPHEWGYTTNGGVKVLRQCDGVDAADVNPRTSPELQLLQGLRQYGVEVDFAEITGPRQAMWRQISNAINRVYQVGFDAGYQHAALAALMANDE